MKITFRVLCLAVFVCILVSAGYSQKKDLPKDYKQLLERGKIAAITNPEFVTADEAKIADDSWILGVIMNGQARAYSLNLLNSHEVVNDKIGDISFAAVW